MRRFLLAAAAGVWLSATGQLTAALNDEIITDATAQRYGLTRVWVTQAQVNRARGRLQTIVLYDGMLHAKSNRAAIEEDPHRWVLYVQSNRATLEAIDAETGQQLWSKMIGQPIQPSLPPSVCRDLLATINGSTLYVLNRFTGDIVYHTVVDGAVGGGPALSCDRVYVPMVTGLIMSYQLKPVTDAAKDLGKIDPNAAEMSDDEKKEARKKAEEDRRENIRIQQEYIPPLACSSYGRALVAPVVTMQLPNEEGVAWVTDRGYLYAGRVLGKTFSSKYRLPTKGTFSNPPTYLASDPKKARDPSIIFAGSSDGYVYAVQEQSGDVEWKFPMSEPVIDSPVVINDRLYATTELGGMFCLYAKTGKQIWWAPEILHFVAEGKERVYAADKLGRLRILDRRTGATIDTLPTTAMPIKVSNDETDRVYLATEGGTIQCLRELEQPTPVAYNEVRNLPPDNEPKAAAKLKPRAGGDVAAKVAQDRPAAKKTAKKEPDADGVGFGGDADPGDKPAKPAKGKAVAGAKAKGAAKKDPAAADPLDAGDPADKPAKGAKGKATGGAKGKGGAKKEPAADAADPFGDK